MASHPQAPAGSGSSNPPGSPPAPGWEGIASDWSSDREAFKQVPWGKAMMWIFLLSDTFVFTCFLTGYMSVRMTITDLWPNPSEVFALTIGGKEIPLILIAIMTFVLISSSGTMAMQAFEWSKLISEGVRPWGNPMGAAQFGASFFMITGFHGLHVSIGAIYLSIVAMKVWRGDYERSGNYQNVEIAGLYWHFVDVVGVVIFAFFNIW